MFVPGSSMSFLDCFYDLYTFSRLFPEVFQSFPIFPHPPTLLPQAPMKTIFVTRFSSFPHGSASASSLTSITAWKTCLKGWSSDSSSKQGPECLFGWIFRVFGRLLGFRVVLGCLLGAFGLVFSGVPFGNRLFFGVFAWCLLFRWFFEST